MTGAAVAATAEVGTHSGVDQIKTAVETVTAVDEPVSFAWMGLNAMGIKLPQLHIRERLQRLAEDRKPKQEQGPPKTPVLRLNEGTA